MTFERVLARGGKGGVGDLESAKTFLFTQLRKGDDILHNDHNVLRRLFVSE